MWEQPRNSATGQHPSRGNSKLLWSILGVCHQWVTPEVGTGKGIFKPYLPSVGPEHHLGSLEPLSREQMLGQGLPYKHLAVFQTPLKH